MNAYEKRDATRRYKPAAIMPANFSHKILTKAVIRGIDDDDKKAVDIFCDSDSAKALLTWANQVDSAAGSQITVDVDPTT